MSDWLNELNGESGVAGATDCSDSTDTKITKRSHRSARGSKFHVQGSTLRKIAKRTHSGLHHLRPVAGYQSEFAKRTQGRDDAVDFYTLPRRSGGSRDSSVSFYQTKPTRNLKPRSRSRILKLPNEPTSMGLEDFRSQIAPEGAATDSASVFYQTNPLRSARRFKVRSSKCKVLKNYETNPSINRK